MLDIYSFRIIRFHFKVVREMQSFLHCMHSLACLTRLGSCKNYCIFCNISTIKWYKKNIHYSKKKWGGGIFKRLKLKQDKTKQMKHDKKKEISDAQMVGAICSPNYRRKMQKLPIA